MVRFKSSDLVTVGLAQIRIRVDNCKPTVLEYVANIADEMRYGLHVDKTIDEKLYYRYKKDLYDIIEEFKKKCTCDKK